MVERLNLEHKFTLVNSPAGSGKTTLITNTVRGLVKVIDRNILCITYTNRATDQLLNKIDFENVEIGTIHSFIGQFMKSFFKLKDIIDLYMDIYKKDIEFILFDNNEKSIDKKNRYAEKFDIQVDGITLNTIKENIKYLEYGETPYSSYLYGKLSHDDLLSFSKKVFSRYPKLKRAMSYRYSYIFIDEYQDTSSEILNLFYEVTLQGDTKLILLGDEMQQIYPEALGDFQEVIDANFIRDFTLKNNWRSQKYIVDSLNSLYFDSTYKQEAKVGALEKPRLHIISNISEVDISKNVLQLVLLNSDLFKAIDAYHLFSSYNIRYPQYHKYKVKDILSDMTIDNYDDLIGLLVFAIEICKLYEEKRFSELIEKSKKPRFSNKEIWYIKNHLEKKELNRHLNELCQFIKQDITIGECLEYLKKNKLFIESSVNEVIENIGYEEGFQEKIIETKFQELINCYIEMKKPRFSTQHAVKGEGHDNVALKISDGNNASVNVKMYFFLELFSNDLFEYNNFKEMGKRINKAFDEFVQKTMITPSSTELKADLFNELKGTCDGFIGKLEEALLIDINIYNLFYKEIFIKYKKRPGVTSFKKCAKEAKKIAAVLLAYKLFYVGCSRAKKELNIYLTDKDVTNYKDKLIKKFESIGFNVLNVNVEI